MSLKITSTITTCNGIDLPTQQIADLLALTLGTNWAAQQLYMGGDWNSSDRDSERAACLYVIPAVGPPTEVLASSAYSALIRAIVARPEFTVARAGADPVINEEFKRRISAALLDKSASLEREASYLLRLVITGTALTNDQKAEAAMLDAINLWETAMISKRDALLDAHDTTSAMIDATWPPAPIGLSDFLKKGW